MAILGILAVLLIAFALSPHRRSLQKLLHTSKAESESAASNIFVAHTDAPLVVKPYLANFSSIAILLGGLGAVIPGRRHDIARLGLKAVIGGTLVNLMNAAIAGLFFSLQSL